MNAQEALARRELFGRPLVFGDDAQIRARKFLEEVALAEDAYLSCDAFHLENNRRECDQCDGNGYLDFEDFRDACDVCHGDGSVLCFDGSCECVQPFSHEVRQALAARLAAHSI